MKKYTKNDNSIIIGGNSGFADKVFENLLEERKIIINTEIDPDVVETIILQIIKFNKEDKDLPVEQRKPIVLLISSGGGDVISGLGVIDAIQNSKTPVHAVVLTMAYSMAFLIYVVCHKRYMLPNSSLLIHDGSMAMMGSANKVKDLQEFYGKLDLKLKQIVVNHSKITSREYEKNKDRELYLFPEDAAKKGLVDGVVYQDVNIDDIF